MIYPSRLILSSWIVVARRHQDEARGRQVSIDAILLQPTFLNHVSWATYEAACVVCPCVGRERRVGGAMAIPGCEENAMLIDTRMKLEDGRCLLTLSCCNQPFCTTYPGLLTKQLVLCARV